jgi:hypothetical protein
LFFFILAKAALLLQSRRPHIRFRNKLAILLFRLLVEIVFGRRMGCKFDIDTEKALFCWCSTDYL